MTSLKLLLLLLIFVLPIYSAKRPIRKTSTKAVRFSNRRHTKKFKTPVTLDAKNAKIENILEVLANKSGLNIVTGSSIDSERISIKLTNCPLDETINLVVRAAGLSYEISGQSVLVAKKELLMGDIGVRSHVIRLAYVDAADVAESISHIAKNIKIDKASNSLICYASPRIMEEITYIVKKIDIPQLQLVFECKLTEISDEAFNSIGIDWNKLLSFSSVLYEGLPLGNINFSSGNTQNVNLLSGFSGNSWYRQQLKFELGLDLLASSGKANVLTNTSIATMNYKKASIHVGKKVPLFKKTFSDGNVEWEVEYINVGTNLTITPFVNSAGDIKVSLEPEISTIDGWKGPYSDVPIISTRKVKSTITVKNGQKIFLAGLINEEKVKSIQKVPLLGSIPFVGKLFQKQVMNIEKRNLIIEITPTIIDSKGFNKNKVSISKKLDTKEVK